MNYRNVNRFYYHYQRVTFYLMIHTDYIKLSLSISLLFLLSLSHYIIM